MSTSNSLSVSEKVVPSATTGAEPKRPAITIHQRIEPTAGWVSLRLGELWRYRELLYFITWRDVKVRYKQTALGAAWAVLQPLLNMVVFTLFFGRLAKVPSDGMPYAAFCLAGLVPWTFFATSLTQTSNSLVGSANLIKKVYFPRLAVPIATVFAAVVDFCIGFVCLAPVLLYYGATPSWRLLYLPLFFLLALTTALAVGFWLSALNVNYRDVRYVVPFLSQFWMLATPVAYPSSLLKEPWRTVFGLNPMAGVVEGFRWALLGAKTAPGPMIAVSSCVALALLLSGAYYFRRMERNFADVV
jgi:lipopolysaccharide transport system permease protein